MGALPLHWWLPTLLIQQTYTIIRLGIRLTRQSGQVGLLMNKRQLGLLTANPANLHEFQKN